MAPLIVGADPRSGMLVGDTAVFATANVALDLPRAAKQGADGAIELELDANNGIDVRVVNAEVAKWLPATPDKDGIVSHVVVHGDLAVAITAKGPAAQPVAWAIWARRRVPRADELAKVAPKRVDLDAPRLLWLPPTG
jgi:hypothetical protein